MSDISSIGTTQQLNSAVSDTSDPLKAQMAVKLLKATQKSAETAGSIIEDTVSISKEAMDAYNAEKA